MDVGEIPGAPVSDIATARRLAEGTALPEQPDKELLAHSIRHGGCHHSGSSGGLDP